MKGRGKFDQAGLMVYVNEHHWIKTGLEYVDGSFQLSAVVTNEFSDWSTQKWSSDRCRLRLYRFGCDFVIESLFGEEWRFFRICRLKIGEGERLKIGPFCASPKDGGSEIVFTKFSVAECDSYEHNNSWRFEWVGFETIVWSVIKWFWHYWLFWYQFWWFDFLINVLACLRKPFSQRLILSCWVFS